jgi:peptide/nickel transport system ATP-binding protein
MTVAVDAPVLLDAPILLDVRGLRTRLPSRHGTVTAVDGVDLEIRRGEVLALVGESGSGKSMTALSIMRLLPPGAHSTASTLRLGDDHLLALSDNQMNAVRGARIAMLFQHPRATLDPTSPIGDQVGEALRLHRGVSRQDAWRRSVELLAKVGIPEPERRAHAYVHQISGGMAQRVMIAAALSGGPDLLIADEPTTALDVTVQAQILRLLAETRRETGLSMLLITHDLGIVAAVADRVAVMYAGQIVEEASVKAIFDAPQHPYTKALLRSSFLSPDESGRLYAIPGGPPTPGRQVVGCRFRARCHVADEAGIADHCEGAAPPLTLIGAGHASRCWAGHAEVERR